MYKKSNFHCEKELFSFFDIRRAFEYSVHMRHAHESKRSKIGSGQYTKAPRVSASTSKSLRKRKELGQSIWATYVKSRAVQTKLVAANRNAKPGVI